MTDKTYELSIDTSKTDETLVAIIRDGQRFEKKIQKKIHTSQEVLPMIEELLRDHSLALSDITAISVNPGPGSYTGLRVGIAVATALSVLLSVPINGQAPGALIAPNYGKDAWV